MAPTTIDLPAIKQRTWTSELSYTPTNIVSYNISIGVDGKDLSRCWEDHPNFHVLPTFASLAVVNMMGSVTRAMSEFLPNFKSYNHVHGEHYLEQFTPFPVRFPGTTLISTAQIVDIVDRGKGVTVAVGITTKDKSTGEKICYNEWTSFIRQVPGRGATSPAGARPQASTNLPSRPPDTIDTHKTTQTQSALYRATTTEWNPMHISPAHAKEGGFSAPILSGTCTIGMGVKHIIDAFAGGDVSRFKSVRLRLSAPVIIGEEVRTEMWVSDMPESLGVASTSSKGSTRIIYRQVVAADELAGSKNRIVISNAVVELWDEEVRSKM
ncbi:hypothetical protein H2198_006696 [Neophaeococcomyces mojaviensis]|uniref:Uncharacterized protein n=1 Tax=Neophaeococcomyces mojaviensis TaxID=3383035 RepID=A0ACC3A2P5_9EURO|nr:hypothetical protein H2198_006696 [Knufia sp. JES_112]